MLEFAAVTYGALASFVMASVHRNRRLDVENPQILVMFGLGLFGFSLVMGAMLIGYVGYEQLAVA